MNQTDRHSQLSPNGELANIARFGQSVFAQDKAKKSTSKYRLWIICSQDDHNCISRNRIGPLEHNDYCSSFFHLERPPWWYLPCTCILCVHNFRVPYEMLLLANQICQINIGHERNCSVMPIPNTPVVKKLKTTQAHDFRNLGPSEGAQRLFRAWKFLPTLCAGSGAKHVQAEGDYFTEAYLFATSSQFTTLQNAAM
jgi:hypothetical protein